MRGLEYEADLLALNLYGLLLLSAWKYTSRD